MYEPALLIVQVPKMMEDYLRAVGVTGGRERRRKKKSNRLDVGRPSQTSTSFCLWRGFCLVFLARQQGIKKERLKADRARHCEPSFLLSSQPGAVGRRPYSEAIRCRGGNRSRQTPDAGPQTMTADPSRRSNRTSQATRLWLTAVELIAFTRKCTQDDFSRRFTVELVAAKIVEGEGATDPDRLAVLNCVKGEWAITATATAAAGHCLLSCYSIACACRSVVGLFADTQ